jgi:hypothetical protein
VPGSELPRASADRPVFRRLIALTGDLAGTVVTADQLHTQRKHACSA